jgi:hypothetical protein
MKLAASREVTEAVHVFVFDIFAVGGVVFMLVFLYACCREHVGKVAGSLW